MLCTLVVKYVFFASYIYIKKCFYQQILLCRDGRKCLDRTTPYASHEHLSYLVDSIYR